MACSCMKRKKSKVGAMSKAQSRILRQAGMAFIGGLVSRVASGAISAVPFVEQRPMLKTGVKILGAGYAMLGQSNEDVQSAGLGIGVETLIELAQDKGIVKSAVSGFYRNAIAGGYLNDEPILSDVQTVDSF